MARKKMDPVLKKRWIRALRSKRYHQTPNALHALTTLDDGTQVEGHCCLGVAEVACRLPRTWKKPSDQYPIVHGISRSGDEGSFLTPEAEARLGITHKTQDKLSHFNDNGRDFNEIADWIEKYL